MGPGNAYRRADHAAVSVDSRRAVLVGGVSDVRTTQAAANLRLEIVQLTNTLPGVIIFDLDGDRQTGAFKAVGTPPSRARALASRCEQR